MKPGIPWSVKGIDGKAREVAKDAARAEGLTLGEWLNQKILESAQEDAELKARATRKKATSSTSRRTSPQPASPTPQPARTAAAQSVSSADAVADRLEALFERIAGLQSPAHAPAQRTSTIESGSSAIAMEKLLDRIESGESRNREALEHMGDRVERIGSRVEELAERPMEIKARDLPGFTALEGAVRNIVDHIEKSEAKSRETMTALQSRIAEIHGKVENTPEAESASSKIVQDLERRMAQLAAQVEKVSASSDDKQLKSIFEARIRELAERIDTVRHSAEAISQKAAATASKAAEEQARAIENRLASLVEQAESKLAEAGSGGRGLAEIQSEIAQLHNRFEEIRQQAASDHEVQALRTALENLSSRVEENPAQEPIAQIEQRIAELTEQLQQVAQPVDLQPHLGHLEQRIQALDTQMATAASQHGQPDDVLAQQIHQIENRLAATEHQLGSLGTIENSIQQLFASLEQSQAETRQLIANATMGPASADAPGHTAETAEFKALQDGLAAVRANAEAADQRTQETLEAVHETLAQIIDKLAEIDRGGPRSTGTSSTGVDEIAASAAAAAAALAGANAARPAEAPMAAEAASGHFSPFDNPAPNPDAMPMPDIVEAASQSWQSSQQSTAQPAQPAGEDWLSVVRAHMQQQHGGVRAAEAHEPPMAGGTGHVDFIAAARRAASAATPASPAGATLSASHGFTAATATVEESKQQSRLASLLSRKSEKAGGKPAKEKGEQGSSRKRLVLAALVLLAAFSAYTVNSGWLAPAPQQQSSLSQPSMVQSAAPVQQIEPQSLASANVKVDLPTNGAPVEIPQQEAATSLMPADPITTASTGTAASDPMLSQQPQVLGQPITAAPAPAQALSDELPEQIGTEALRQAALNGDAKAQFIVASRYLEGRAIGRDHDAAARWYTRAANGGLSAAQYRIGTLYERGSGVPQDRFQAVSWYAKAAEQGNVKAMHNLAVLAADSTAGKPDMDRAAKWFAAAASHGLPDSQYNLAVLHERGLGVPKNLNEAYKWYSLAARQGDRDAVKKSEAIKSQLDANSRAQIDAIVASWKPEPANREANMVSVSEPSWGIQQPQQASAAPAMPAQPPMNAEPVQTLSAKDQVKLAQQLLAQKGFDPGTADGEMGSRTANAIRLYQLRNGLPVNGSVSRQLLDHLQKGMI